ncbi:hypothetical protein [Altericroceibacterium xinjiangense]|uniref:hypothetical protein n=1 Tax=Altericroceibacterium xinjiangense TaxID=762261 RepID=UPI000F7F0A52|nr:hypothetical protein [Altericroceibacterium xinjiangense]
MPEASREDLTIKIEAAEERNRQRAENSSSNSLMERAGETAVEAKDGVLGYAHDHPFTTVIGGFALGAVLGAMFPRHPARKVAKAGRGAAKAGGAAAGLAATAADTAMEYIRQALEAAEDAAVSGKETLEDTGRAAGYKLHKAGEAVGDKARSLADDAAAAEADVSARASRIIN